jgi:hypothetical protein
MGIREQFRKTVTMTVLQRQCMVIVTLLSTLCLLTAWPRFRSDAMSLEWYVYLFLVFIFLIPLFKRN